MIFVAVAPTVAGDISQAQTLAARGVQVPLVSATFTTQKHQATSAVGADSCSLSGATVRFSFNGAPHTATLREVKGEERPTCADALNAAAKLDYAPGTPLLVDPQNPGGVALVSEVARQTANSSRAATTRTVGIVLLVLGGVFALLALVPSRRSRATLQAGPPGSLPFGPPAPPSQSGSPSPAQRGRPATGVMTTSRDSSDAVRKHRTLGEQLNRNSRVMHASWLAGLSVLLAGSGAGGFGLAGLVFLVVVFLPMIVAYRRDRLSFLIVFASLFLPAWPWAMYEAASRAPRAAPTPTRPT